MVIAPLLCVFCLLAPALWAAPPGAEGPSEGTVTLAFVGDVSFAGRRGRAAKLNPMSAFADVFADADLAVVNVEGLLVDSQTPIYGESRLNISARPHWAARFSEAGFDLLTTANNHTWDGGAAGLLESLGHLRATGIPVIGSGAHAEEAERAYVLDTQPGCVSVLPATRRSNRSRRIGASAAYYPREAGLTGLVGRVQAAAATGCFVVVSIHWGREAVHTPPRYVQATAKRLTAAGADLVVGHHPHVLQGIAFHGQAAVAYSLGNFVFTNRDPAKRRTGVLIAELVRTATGRLVLTDLSLIPAIIRVPDFAPGPATAAEARDLTERLAAYSRPFGTAVRLEGDRVRFRPATPGPSAP